MDAKASARTFAKLSKSEKTEVAKLNTVAVRRLDLLKNMKDRLDAVKSDLVEESQQRAAPERMRTNHFCRVSPDLAHMICAFHKEFSLTANYPKGHGDRDWMIKRYPK